MSTITESAFRVSPRRELRPGMTFRTIRGSGPTFNGEAVGEFSTFRCLRFYRRRRRLYAVAINERTGGVHDLFIEGPAFTSPTGTRERPYRIKLTADQPRQPTRSTSLQRSKPR